MDDETRLLLERLLEVRSGQWPRLSRLRAAVAAPVERLRPVVDVPDDAPEQLSGLAESAEVNYLAHIESTILDLLSVSGIDADTDVDPWLLWQAAGLDAGQRVVHQSALRYGVGYALVRGDGAVQPLSARQVTGLVDTWDGSEWLVAALRCDGDRVALYDAERVRVWRAKSARGLAGPQEGFRVDDLEFVSDDPHGMGVCPVVQFRHLHSGHGEALGGVLEHIVAAQTRLNRTQYELDVAKFFSAFRQLYVSGFMPKSLEEEIKLNVGKLAYFADPGVKIETVDPGPLDRYFAAKRDALHDMQVLAALSLTDFGGEAASNVNVETLVAAESAKTRRANAVRTSLGESWELVFRLMGRATGDTQLAADTACEVRWDDVGIRTFAQMADATTKLIASGFDAREAFAMLPGMSDTTLDRAVAGVQQQQQGNALSLLRSAAAERQQRVSTPDGP